jgi:hypothetical protein
VLHWITPKFGGIMAYGSDEFLNKVSELLGHKYDKEIAVLQQDNVSLQQDKLQSIILLEVLAELKYLNIPVPVDTTNTDLLKTILTEVSKQNQKPVEIPKATPYKDMVNTPTSLIPNPPISSIPSASDQPKRT